MSRKVGLGKLVAVADLVGGVHMHPPLAASNVFLRTQLHESIK